MNRTEQPLPFVLKAGSTQHHAALPARSIVTLLPT
jgi:hypothetical protein